MPKGVQVVAFEGGALRFLASGETGREAVLALPLNRLIVKMVRVPAGEDRVAFATPLLQKASPFPDDQLTVGLFAKTRTERPSSPPPCLRARRTTSPTRLTRRSSA